MIYLIKVYGKSSSSSDKIIIYLSFHLHISRGKQVVVNATVIVYDSCIFFICHPANSFARYYLTDEIRELTLALSCNYSITDCLAFPGIITGAILYYA